MTDWLTDWINYQGVWRTAPATPGLFKKSFGRNNLTTDELYSGQRFAISGCFCQEPIKFFKHYFFLNKKKKYAKKTQKFSCSRNRLHVKYKKNIMLLLTNALTHPLKINWFLIGYRVPTHTHTHFHILIITLHAMPTPNDCWQEIIGRIAQTWKKKLFLWTLKFGEYRFGKNKKNA